MDHSMRYGGVQDDDDGQILHDNQNDIMDYPDQVLYYFKETIHNN